MCFFRVMPYGGEKHINKIPPKSRGQSREHFVYVFFFFFFFFSLPRATSKTVLGQRPTEVTFWVTLIPSLCLSTVRSTSTFESMPCGGEARMSLHRQKTRAPQAWSRMLKCCFPPHGTFRLRTNSCVVDWVRLSETGRDWLNILIELTGIDKTYYYYYYYFYFYY